MLARGAQGPAVKSLQEELVTLGLLSSSDIVSVFGPKTEAAVLAIQKYALNDAGTSAYSGVRVSGIIDVATRGVIDDLIAMTRRIDPASHAPEYVRFDIASKIRKYL
jgi:peptidoglycan hydrolase-like protein with peptidoglycan-binding domain